MVTMNRDRGGVNFTEGVATRVDASNVTATPTLAELTAAFGDPALPENKGKIFIQDDAGADTGLKLIVGSGVCWFFVALTKAT